MTQEILGRNASYHVMPDGVYINPKTSEMTNFDDVHIDKAGNVVFLRSSNAERTYPEAEKWTDTKHFEREYKDLFEFAHIENSYDVEEYAHRHGPLFGTRYCVDGTFREPLSMWRFAKDLVQFGLKVKAAVDGNDWKRLRDETSDFGIDFLGFSKAQESQIRETGICETKKGQPVSFFFSKLFGNEMPDDYKDFVLDHPQPFGGVWYSQKWDPPGTELKVLEVGPARTIEQQATDPQGRLQVSIFLNCDGALGRPFSELHYDSIPLGQSGSKVDDEVGVKLCRLMSEALISLHCRKIDYDWVGHRFWPILDSKIRYLWYIYAIYKDKTSLGFCKHCGHPYLKTRAAKQYCTSICKRRANK